VAAPLYESSIKSLPLLGRGKVRDMYALGDDRLLIVTTDRLSAFDVVLPDPIPDKGEVLNEMSNFWFRKLAHIVPNHLNGAAPQTVIKGADEAAQVAGRAVVVQKLKPLPVEAVVRGYLIGSGWKDYQSTGALCGIPLPKGLKQADKLPEVIFTPATKAEAGAHDENISFDQVEKLVGNRVGQHDIESRQAIGRDDEQAVVAHGVHIADFSPPEKRQALDARFEERDRHPYAACFSISGRYLPCAASPFICARWWNARCAAATLPGAPRQALSAGFWSARL